MDGNILKYKAFIETVHQGQFFKGGGEPSLFPVGY